MDQADPITRLAQRLAPDADRRRRILGVPGCWDGLSALLVEQAGFECAFLTGSGLAMARLGRPDVGLVTASELCDTVAAIRDRVAIPLIVDGDTGFGNALNLQRTVRMVERAGASALQVEDQTFPKRCGHLAGKTVVPLPDAIGRIKAALDARATMLVIARTDARAVDGLSAAFDRADAFIEAGADAIFIEGPFTRAELETVGTRFGGRAPLVHNMVEGVVNPADDGADLEALGFAIALHPLLLMHGFVKQAPHWLAHLAAHGSTQGLKDTIADLPALNGLVGTAALLAKAARFE